MKKHKYMIAGVVLVILAVAFGIIQWQQSNRSGTVTSTMGQEQLESTSSYEEETIISDEPEETETEEPYESPIDFAALQAVNPDIYAWLEVPGADISEPVVYRDGDNSFYVDHNSDGEAASEGAVFSEDYNGQDFTDPVTILYGHNMRSGAIFGNLQEYFSDSSFCQENRTFTIYTEYAEYEYQIFAAVPYGNAHILYYHDFSDFSVMESFVEDIYATRSLKANVDESITIEEGDRIVILSTCMDGSSSQRYLVMGVCKSIS